MRGVSEGRGERGQGDALFEVGLEELVVDVPVVHRAEPRVDVVDDVHFHGALGAGNRCRGGWG